MSEIVERIIRDTAAGRLKWTCGGHSDIWSATGAEYQIEESPGGIIFTHLIVTRPGGHWIRLRAGPFLWRRIKAAMPSKEISPEAMLKGLR